MWCHFGVSPCRTEINIWRGLCSIKKAKKISLLPLYVDGVKIISGMLLKVPSFNIISKNVKNCFFFKSMDIWVGVPSIQKSWVSGEHLFPVEFNSDISMKKNIYLYLANSFISTRKTSRQCRKCLYLFFCPGQKYFLGKT